jgi:hypothetical protein
MVWLILVVAVVVLFALAIAFTKKTDAKDALPGYPYERIPALFTPAERSFLGVLDLAAGKDFRVFGKVRVADVLSPRANRNKSVWQTAFNKINRKHFDFVLCAPGDLNVLCAIELDDKSHQKKERQERDDFLENACHNAGLPLISFQAQHAYSPTEISAKIALALAGRVSMGVDSAEATADGRHEPSILSAFACAPACPRCASPMVKRIAKGGENAGREFWGCSDFPKCREIVSI